MPAFLNVEIDRGTDVRTALVGGRGKNSRGTGNINHGKCLRRLGNRHCLLQHGAAKPLENLQLLGQRALDALAISRSISASSIVVKRTVCAVVWRWMNSSACISFSAWVARTSMW